MKKLNILTVASMAAGLMLFANAEAQPKHGPERSQGAQSGMRGQGMMGGMQGCMRGQGMMGGMQGGFNFYLNLAGQLDLTGAQIGQLRDMKFAFDKANIQRRAGLQTARLELQRLRNADKVDPKQVEAAIRGLSRKQAEQEIAVFRARMAARKVLTAEQKEKLETLTCPLCGGMHGGMGGGKMMHGGMMPCGMMQQGQQHR